MNIKKSILISFFTLSTVLISAGHYLNLTLKPPQKDGMHYIAYAYNTLKYGVYSHSRSENPESNNRREPMYPIALMVAMIIDPGINLSTQDAQCITEGKHCIELVTKLKLINIVFLMCSALISAFFVFRYTRNIFSSFICFILVSLSGNLGRYTGTFYTESLAALLLIAVSFLLYELVEQGFTKRRAFIVGLSLGALSLTKAIYLYFIYLNCILLFVFWLYQKKGIKKTIKEVSILLLGSFILLAPWFAHNYLEVGTLSMVGGRSGVNLLARAHLNEITQEEYLASILLLLPKSNIVNKLQKKYISPEIKDRVKNNKYYKLSYAEQKQIEKTTGLRGSQLNDYVVNLGIKRILNNFKKHLALIPLVSLRGIVNTERGIGYQRFKNDYKYENIGEKYFNFNIGKYNYSVTKIYNYLIFMLSFGTFIRCIFVRKWSMVWFLLPLVYCFGMYAFLTPFAGRFSYHFIPILITCSIIAIFKISLFLKLRFVHFYKRI